MICQVSGRECPTLDEHHIIPREYGGVSGPTIWIDPAIHQAIHRYANNPTRLATFLDSFPLEVRERIQTLVLAIRTSQSTLERVNKYQLTITLNKEEYDILTELAKDMNTSEVQIARRLLGNLLESVENTSKN